MRFEGMAQRAVGAAVVVWAGLAILAGPATAQLSGDLRYTRVMTWSRIRPTRRRRMAGPARAAAHETGVRGRRRGIGRQLTPALR